MGLLQYLWKWLSKASPTPIRIAEIVVLLITLTGFAVNQLYPKGDPKTIALVWQLPLGLLIVTFIVSLVVSSYNLYKEQHKTITELDQQLDVARKMAYPPITILMMSPYFKSLDIPLGDFGLVNQILANKTFDHCRIHGPAVICLSHATTVTACVFNGDLESMFIVTTNERVGGVLEIKNCTFVNCTFDKVSFIGPQEQIDKIKKGFKSEE